MLLVKEVDLFAAVVVDSPLLAAVVETKDRRIPIHALDVVVLAVTVTRLDVVVVAEWLFKKNNKENCVFV